MKQWVTKLRRQSKGVEQQQQSDKGAQPTKQRHLSRGWFIFLLVQIGLFTLLLAYFVMQPVLNTQLTAKRSDLLAQQAQMQKALASIPSPQEMQPGIQNSQARYVVDETGRQTDVFIDASSNVNLNIVDRIYSRLARKSPLQRTISQFSDIHAQNTAARSTLRNYHALLEVVLRFIEYNPAVDMREYQADDSDTQERLQRLERGLTDTQSGLGQLGLETELQQSISSTIQQAQSAQEQLAGSGDVDAFIDSIESLQAELIQILVSHHRDVQAAIRQGIIDAIRLMQ